MGLFGKETKPDPVMGKPSVPATSSIPRRSEAMKTILSPQVHFHGKIRGEGDIIVHGSFEGQIKTSARIVIDKTGKVKADIKGREIMVAGKVQGNLEGLELVELKQEGVVEGDIRAPKVIIAEGAVFKGSVDMKVVEESGEKQKKLEESPEDQEKDKKNKKGEPKDGGK